MLSKKTKLLLMGCLIGFLIVPLIVRGFAFSSPLIDNFQNIKYYNDIKELQHAGTGNEGLISTILDTKIDAFQSEGYFPGAYLPSLRGTYYAIEIFSMLGEMIMVNENSIANFLIARFNESANLFGDAY